MTKNNLIFLIVDGSGFPWSIAPTRTEARRQIAWFLPKGNQYYINPVVV